MKRTKEDIAAELTGMLWDDFLSRVSYARLYTDMVTRRGGCVVIDHIGFRTLNTHTGEQPGGIWGIRHIFECLGYTPSGKYSIAAKNIKAVHFESVVGRMPKIFVSQLEVSQLPAWVQLLFPEMIANTPYLLSDTGIELLNKVKTDGSITQEAADILIAELVKYFRRPWSPPYKESVLKINDVSHYAAWVLLHGNSPSHFASLMNVQNVSEWQDIKTTSQAMQYAGIPMKHNIEGNSETLLQQSATLAVKEEVTVKDDGMYHEIPWTYAYLELIQRNHDRSNGEVLFQNFLEDHERHLYKMTMTLEN